MINKVGYKLLFSLWVFYALSLLAYLFWVVHILSHKACSAVLFFAFLCIVIDYAVLVVCHKYQKRLGRHIVSDISIITLLYTLMHFFTVIFARNILEIWQYALIQSLFFVFCLVSVLPKTIVTLKNNL